MSTVKATFHLINHIKVVANLYPLRTRNLRNNYTPENADDLIKKADDTLTYRGADQTHFPIYAKSTKRHLLAHFSSAHEPFVPLTGRIRTEQVFLIS